jgi:serine/threonine protein kinase
MPVLTKGDSVNETYLIHNRIGRGAFGEVFRVEHQHMGNQVLKLLSKEYVDKNNIETIMGEARILTNLTHPNVVRVYEANSFEREGRKHYYVTMGFVSGEPLSRLWDRESPFSMSFALKIQREILSGLQAAHDHEPPIIHRDVNGDNVLLSYSKKEPSAMLADFGLAKTVDAVSWSEDSAGRFGFLAPECFFGTYLPSSDVFSAGIVFYRMVTGVFPWQYDLKGCGEVNEMQTAVLAGRKKDLIKPSVHNPACDRSVEQAILKSLAVDLTKRYQSAGEFLNDLNGSPTDN